MRLVGFDGSPLEVAQDMLHGPKIYRYKCFAKELLFSGTISVTVVRRGVIASVARAAVQSRLQICLHCNNKPTSNSVG